MAGNAVKFARMLRCNSSNAEKEMWACLRAKRFLGLKFKRQDPIGRYIVDFVCHSKKLIIEIDGGQHALPESKDRQRDLFLSARGYKVLRFWNNDVLCNLEPVMQAIYNEVKA